MIHSDILTSLNMLDVPVSFQLYKGEPADTYITFHQYDESNGLSASNKEIITNYYFQINIFSKKDYFELVRQVKEKMIELGGIRINENDQALESGYYMRSLRFQFYKNESLGGN